MKSLLSLCMGYLLSHANYYWDQIPMLPPHLKNRILKRITTIQLHSNFKYMYRCLIHSHLKQIDFSQYEIDDELLKLISGCTLLRKLILTRNKENRLSESALLEVLSNFKNLYIFHAPNCLAITNKVMKVLIQNNYNLMELDISDCKNVDDKTFIELASLKKLAALNISRTNVTPEGIKLYLQGNAKSSLKELRMSECPLITAKAINLISEQCEALEVFIFNNCVLNSDLDKTSINFENENLKKLKQLTWSVYW